MFAPPPPPPPPPPATISIARLYEQPAERSFINGLRYYEEGQYERAEVLLKRSLADGLKDRNDVAVAQKHLAFIACAYSRPSDCEQAFRAAFAADPVIQAHRRRGRASHLGACLQAGRRRANSQAAARCKVAPLEFVAVEERTDAGPPQGRSSN